MNLLRRALLQLVAIEKARLSGDFSDKITDAAFEQRAAVAEPAAIPVTKSLSSLISDYRNEEADPDRPLAGKTTLKHEAVTSVLLRYFGAERDVSTITRPACRSFRDLLAKLPPNFTKRQKSGNSFDDVAQANEKVEGPRLGRATQATYLDALARILAYAKAEGHIDQNPLEPPLVVKGAQKRREDARNGYSVAQLRKIFASPIYLGCVDDERRYKTPKPGNVIRRSRFWLPLIALFTGLRMNEILQLTRWHIQLADDGLPCLLIGANMQLKTAASYRVVPVPDMLIKTGFISFAESRRNEDDLLFPDVPAGSDGYRSTIFSKRYSTFQEALNLQEPGRSVRAVSGRSESLRIPPAAIF